MTTRRERESEPGFVELPFGPRTYPYRWVLPDGTVVPGEQTYFVAPKHGTEHAYQKYGCRCSDCRAASAAGRRARRARAAATR